MKNILLLLLALTLPLVAHAGEIDIFKMALPGSKKVKSTYSATFDDNTAMHMVAIKNKDNGLNELLCFYVDSNLKVKQMETVPLKSEADIKSFHKNGTIATLIEYNSGDLHVINFDVMTGASSLQTLENFPQIRFCFRTTDKTIVVSKPTDYELRTDEFTTAGNHRKNTFPLIDDNNRLIYFDYLEAINTMEFVKTGSVKHNKIYYEDNRIILTKDYRRDGAAKVYCFDLETGLVTIKTLYNDIDRLRELVTYLCNGKLFILSLSKTGLAFRIYDVATGKALKTFDKEALFTNAVEGWENTASFLKDGAKASIKTALTVNTAENGYCVRFDLINPEYYRYYDNFWWNDVFFQQQQMFQQQQQMMINRQIKALHPVPFGPMPEFEVFYTKVAQETEDTSFTIALDENLGFIDNRVPDTDFPQINKQELIQPLIADKNLDNLSIAFSDIEMQYIYQDKKTGELFIKSRLY